MENKKQIELENIYKNEGIAIFIKGKMVVGIHPNNVESNVEVLSNGSMKINWEYLLDTANQNCIIELVNKDEK